jgi:hypothetical protein
MTIQRLNYTKRKKLTLEHVEIQLSRHVKGQPRSFDVTFNLPADLPPDASVIVEAHRSSPPGKMRFGFGTVGETVSPPDSERLLLDFGEGVPPPIFRVKIPSKTSTPSGQLIAAAMGLRPIDPDEDEDKPKGILLTAWRENDGLVWELDLEYDQGPVLYIDSRSDPSRDLPTRPEFRALVYPEIMRRVLMRVVGESPEESEEQGSWQQSWSRFPQLAFGFQSPAPINDQDQGVREAWVEEAVRWCSRKAGFIDSIAPKEVDE